MCVCMYCRASDIKMWSEADKAIYEEQLEHLHTQLTEALVQNQDLKSEQERTTIHS